MQVLKLNHVSKRGYWCLPRPLVWIVKQDEETICSLFHFLHINIQPVSLKWSMQLYFDTWLKFYSQLGNLICQFVIWPILTFQSFHSELFHPERGATDLRSARRPRTPLGRSGGPYDVTTQFYYFVHPPKLVRIGGGHHVNFCVWKKTAITFGEGCTLAFYSLSEWDVRMPNMWFSYSIFSPDKHIYWCPV